MIVCRLMIELEVAIHYFCRVSEIGSFLFLFRESLIKIIRYPFMIVSRNSERLCITQQSRCPKALDQMRGCS